MEFSELRQGGTKVAALTDLDDSGGLSVEEASSLRAVDFERTTANGPLNASALYAVFRYHLVGE